MMSLKLKHLLAIRWFHWVNFPLLSNDLERYSYLLVLRALSRRPYPFFPGLLYSDLCMPILTGWLREWRCTSR